MFDFDKWSKFSDLNSVEKYSLLMNLDHMDQSDEIAEILSKTVLTEKSELISHEACYVIGQLNMPKLIPLLKKVVSNESFPNITRHEALEALSHMDEKYYIEIINQLKKSDLDSLLRDTLIIAEEEMSRTKNENSTGILDPLGERTEGTIEELYDKLMDSNLSLGDKYRCIPTLRSLKNGSIVLGKVLLEDKNSALMRHELCFSLGRLADENTIEYLAAALKDENEEPVVKHEACLALGSIATPEAIETLKLYLNNSNILVKESAEVALDICSKRI